MRAISETLENNIKTAIIYNTDMTLKQMLIMIISELGLIGSKKNFVITSYSIHYTKLYDNRQTQFVGGELGDGHGMRVEGGSYNFV